MFPWWSKSPKQGQGEPTLWLYLERAWWLVKNLEVKAPWAQDGSEITWRRHWTQKRPWGWDRGWSGRSVSHRSWGWGKQLLLGGGGCYVPPWFCGFQIHKKVKCDLLTAALGNPSDGEGPEWTEGRMVAKKRPIRSAETNRQKKLEQSMLADLCWLAWCSGVGQQPQSKWKKKKKVSH